jgi:hypothetical protein
MDWSNISMCPIFRVITHCKTVIKKFCEPLCIYRHENEINNAATELANIIISAANESLKRRNFTKNKKKNKSQK